MVGIPDNLIPSGGFFAESYHTPEMVGRHRRGYSHFSNFLRLFSNLAGNTTSQRNFEFLRNLHDPRDSANDENTAYSPPP